MNSFYNLNAFAVSISVIGIIILTFAVTTMKVKVQQAYLYSGFVPSLIVPC